MTLQLTKQAFWDVDFNDIINNEDVYADWIIRRVAMYGTIEDMLNVDLFYGKEKISNALNSLSAQEKKKASLHLFFNS